MPRPRKNPLPAAEVTPTPVYAYVTAEQQTPPTTSPTQPVQHLQAVPSVPQVIPHSGLYVFGQVTDRTRRMIPTRDNATTEIVTYTIKDVYGHSYYVDQYAPSSYNDIGSIIELPVYVKTFKKRNGDVGYSFGVQQNQGTGPARGEHF